jgi:hypothetical protein
MDDFSPSSGTQPGVEPFRALPLTVSVNAQPGVALEPSDCMGSEPVAPLLLAPAMGRTRSKHHDPQHYQFAGNPEALSDAPGEPSGIL